MWTLAAPEVESEGIEPSSRACKARRLPLTYDPEVSVHPTIFQLGRGCTQTLKIDGDSGHCRTRTGDHLRVEQGSLPLDEAPLMTPGGVEPAIAWVKTTVPTVSRWGRSVTSGGVEPAISWVRTMLPTVSRRGH